MASPAPSAMKRSFSAMHSGHVQVNSPRILYLSDDRPSKRHEHHTPTTSDPSSEVESVSRSRANSPRTKHFEGASPSHFNPDASIILVGMRGSGKSTLAIIASTAMKRRIVDTEMAFTDATGLSSMAFKKKHGNVEYQRRQYRVLDGVLSRYSRDSIIVSAWMERAVQNLLVEYSASHPVIHVIRDEKSTAKYLGVTDVDTFRDLLHYSSSFFRACANYEFFNISEELPKPGDMTVIETTAMDSQSHQKAPAPYLTLKRVERHFLRFLALIMPKNTIPYIESAFPLASIPTENRQFTYAVSVPLSKLLADSVKIEDLEPGVDAIQIVVDDVFDAAGDPIPLSADRVSQISRVFSHIRRNVVIPIIYFVSWPTHGAVDNAQRMLYLEHIQHGLRLVPEYIGLDLRLEDDVFSQIVETKRTSKVIGMVNVSTAPIPSWRDPLWISYYRKARDLRCDLVRLTRPMTHAQAEDNFEISALRHSVEELGAPTLPLIAFNTGVKGRHSQCFNPILTSVIPESLEGKFDEVESKSSSYILPAITAADATKALFASFVMDPMRLYVVGQNVGYSLSPAMHNIAFKACGMPHVYRSYSTESLSCIRELIQDPLFAGASIGQPFKVEVISLTHSLTSHAKAIGAVNTLIPVRYLYPDGSIPERAFLNFTNRSGPVLALYGENTDWIGIRACIRRGLSPANAVRPSSSGLVIGAGGMARAAVYAMLQLGVKNIAVFNRTVANAEKMVAHFTRLLARDDLPLLGPRSDSETRFHVIRSHEEAWPEKFRFPTMIISCIPTHTASGSPAPNFTLPRAWMQNPTGGVVVELGYRYLNTPLLEQVRAEARSGWVALDGLDLLPEQGFAQFELFTGRRAPRRLMREEVLKAASVLDLGDNDQTHIQPRLENIVEQEP
ncbi:type I 3-dehydroquinase-domain-containing protein [Xylariales sp. PMI_506]|nr:type I 3-dehydroquinase-domain-containing protein [Xylariales sp. PMI_506]